jgi:UDP-N-acetylglucosamine acyltransferase
VTRIHATAIIDAGAELHESVEVGPYAVIGAGVRIGEGTAVGAHTVIEGPARIGAHNRIHAHNSLGGPPQDMKYRGEPTALEIGDHNTIREFCTFNRGTVLDAGVTRVGHHNWIMAYVHIAHDVQLADRTILANNATLAGHVHVGDWAIIGGLTGVHQFCHVGAHAMTGFQSRVAQDVPPFMMVEGSPVAVRGFNVEGLRRRGYSKERIACVKQMHRLLYRDGLTLERAREAIAALAGSSDGAGAEADADVRLMLDFLAASTRGIVR